MLEKEIENRLVKEIKKMGGTAYKFTSPGNDGVPDRIVCLPNGDVIFVELKTEKGKLSNIQNRQIKRLENLKQEVTVLYGLVQVLEFIESCRCRLDGEGI